MTTELWTDLIGTAIGKRLSEGIDTPIVRLVAARLRGTGDLLHMDFPLEPREGLFVDRFGDILLVTTYEPGFDPLLIYNTASRFFPLKSLYLQERHSGGALSAPQLVHGDPAAPVELKEYGCTILVDVARGLNPGVFMDTASLRQRLSQGLARGQRVLNLFAYTCTLGVAAIAGGARGVVNVDSSRSVLERGKENYGLNGIPLSPRDFVKADVFEKLKWYKKRGTQFDTVICDPPPRVPGKGPATQLYPLLHERILPLVVPGGTLIYISREVSMSASQFASMLGVQAELLPPRHDIAPSPLESPRFKALLIRV